MYINKTSLLTVLLTTAAISFAGCTQVDDHKTQNTVDDNQAAAEAGTINPQNWPVVKTAPLDAAVEKQIDGIIAKMTVEQKVGQVIQADSNSVTPEDVKTYRLGSVLSGGNSAPGDLPYADAQNWLDAADAYFEASLDTDGVEVAIPIIWGIDAVHGHANLTGAIIFPHNVGLGAANDPDMVKRIAEVTAIELNISGHDWTFAPTLAVPQNDRWGRGYEGFSEDPAIVKSYGGQIVVGLQGEVGSDGFMGPDRVISTAKHFLGDGGTKNGIDQGNAIISEAELRDIHLAGYLTAVEMGAQSVMASFSSWQGQPMHGQKELLTDVLKGRMDFKGFVIGDWNGHALIEGCTATDCPQSLNAGLDMYMAPDTWKGLYESTLKHVQSGEIPMARLDDAVRRILRVKINSGIFEKPKPSARPYSGKVEMLGSEAHRELARESVRKSMVLLKNDDKLLPLSASSRVHVIGAGADSIGKFSGGWTLSWQGGDYDNSDIPSGESFLDAVKRDVSAAGGTVTYDPTGETVPQDVDVVIAVYGENPYAEFLGDRDHVDFTPNDFNPEFLNRFGDSDIPVVSVFLSGRPLWTNPEINASDAFIAAWLPGSEPRGVSDLLFQTDPSFDFTGRLSFSWPKTAMQARLNVRHPDYDPLFKVGYGLSYADNMNMEALPEDSGLPKDGASKKGVFFEKGASSGPWAINVNGAGIEMPYKQGGIELKGFDHSAQEDAIRVSFNDADDVVSISSEYAHDFQRESNGAVELSFNIKGLGSNETAQIGMNSTYLTVPLTAEWTETRISLSCFGNMENLKDAFVIKGAEGLDLAVSNIMLKEESSNSLECAK